MTKRKDPEDLLIRRGLPAPTLSPTDAAWLAGVVETKGYFGTNGGRGNPCFQYQSVRLDMVRRVGKILNAPSVREIKHNGEWSKAPVYAVDLSRQNIVEVFEQVVPYLSQIRRTEVEEWINNFKGE